MSERLIGWDGLVNARDLGGLALATGGSTRFGSVIRADNVRHLTAQGWSQLQTHGVRTIVDLRFALERDETPTPEGILVERISLFGEHDTVEAIRVGELMREARDASAAVTAFYLDTLETCRPNVAAAVEAVARAPEGAVVIHCFVGKDRTGIVAALLLALADVDEDAIVADYALSEGRVGSLVDSWIAEADDPAERELRSRISGAPAAAMERTLAGLRERYGGAERYLCDAGVEPQALDRIRARLRGR